MTEQKFDISKFIDIVEKAAKDIAAACGTPIPVPVSDEALDDAAREAAGWPRKAELDAMAIQVAGDILRQADLTSSSLTATALRNMLDVTQGELEYIEDRVRHVTVSLEK